MTNTELKFIKEKGNYTLRVRYFHTELEAPTHTVRT